MKLVEIGTRDAVQKETNQEPKGAGMAENDDDWSGNGNGEQIS